MSRGRITPEAEVAEAFEDWYKLSKMMEINPHSVAIEVIAAAWQTLLDARERWARGDLQFVVEGEE